MIPVWDIWIRLFHWSLVIAVLFLLFSGETGIGFFEWHRQVGEFVLALILFRILWSIVGSSNASLLSLCKHPSLAIRHLAELARGHTAQERGHNAAGGWAVLAMLTLISFQAVSGLFIADEEELIEGALYSQVDSATSSLLYKLHLTNSHLIQIIIVVHIALVFIYLFYAKRNLILPMLTGALKWDEQSPPPTVRFRHWAVGAALSICIAIAFIWFR